MLQASGLQIEKKKQPSTTQKLRDAFSAQVVHELKSPIRSNTKTIWTPDLGEEYRIIVLGDLHCPVASADALSGLYAIAEQYRPTIIASAGDILDMYA